MAIILRKGKISEQEAYELAGKSDRVENFNNKSRSVYKSLVHDWDLYAEFKKDMLKALGAPMVICRDFESEPGLWLADDEETGVTFMIFSDEHRKKAWKGTSFEAIAPDGKKGLIGEAFERFIGYFKVEPHIDQRDDAEPSMR